MPDSPEVTYVELRVQLHGLARKHMDAEGTRNEVDGILRSALQPDYASDIEVELVTSAPVGPNSLDRSSDVELFDHDPTPSDTGAP